MPLLKITEVAQILRCTPSTVRRMIKDNTIGSTTIGKRHRIDSADLQRYLATQHNLMKSKA